LKRRTTGQVLRVGRVVNKPQSYACLDEIEFLFGYGFHELPWRNSKKEHARNICATRRREKLCEEQKELRLAEAKTNLRFGNHVSADVFI
jgi:hypothetical protein